MMSEYNGLKEFYFKMTDKLYQIKSGKFSKQSCPFALPYCVCFYFVNFKDAGLNILYFLNRLGIWTTARNEA
jgi:hypothetical protein